MIVYEWMDAQVLSLLLVHYLLDCVRMNVVFLFFKQKTAYEKRISDWSSDVCSSDLRTVHDGTRQMVNLARARVKPEETLVEARRDTDVQIVLLTCVKRRKTNRTIK